MELKSFKEFWPYYLSEHAKPLTRTLHFIGTTAAILMMVALAVTSNPWFLLVALIVGYAPAWIAHFFVEKNRPATFRYPLWSLVADFKMWFLLVTGQKLL